MCPRRPSGVRVERQSGEGVKEHGRLDSGEGVDSAGGVNSGVGGGGFQAGEHISHWNMNPRGMTFLIYQMSVCQSFGGDIHTDRNSRLLGQECWKISRKLEIFQILTNPLPSWQRYKK